MRFQDETLRHNACEAVDRFLEKNEGIKKAQLYSLFTAIQAGGYAELSRLIENQKKKQKEKVLKALTKLPGNSCKQKKRQNKKKISRT